MASLIQDSFKISIDVLRFFGLYPSNNSSVLVKVKSILLYFLTYVLVSTLILIGILSNNDYDSMQMNFMVIFLCETVGFGLKVLSLLFDGRRIVNCVNCLEQPDFQPFDFEEKKITDECVYVCHRNSAVFFYGILACVSAWTLPSLQSKGRKLPLNCWLPYDPTADLFNYCATLIFLVTGI